MLDDRTAENMTAIRTWTIVALALLAVAGGRLTTSLRGQTVLPAPPVSNSHPQSNSETTLPALLPAPGNDGPILPLSPTAPPSAPRAFDADPIELPGADDADATDRTPESERRPQLNQFQSDVPELPSWIQTPSSIPLLDEGNTLNSAREGTTGPHDGPDAFGHSPVPGRGSIGGDACADPTLPHAYRDRVLDDPDAGDPMMRVPTDFNPWWTPLVAAPLRSDAAPVVVELGALASDALTYSPRARSNGSAAAIRGTAILEEDAAFDWVAFADTDYDSLNDPVGNLLTTGGARRFLDQQIYQSAGLRRRTRLGGDLEVAQRLGFQDNNSNFFLPTQQGNARLTASYRQPLLGRSGRDYHAHRIVLAQIETATASDRTSAEWQDQLVDTAAAYWDLYRSRAVLLQKQRLLGRAEDALERLDARRGLDAHHRQILHAQAAVARRRSEIARANASIRNAESRLRMLVGSPMFHAPGYVEFVPHNLPPNDYRDVAIPVEFARALEHSPEISRAVRDARAAGVRLDAAGSELLPRLDVVLSAYSAGLEGASGVGSAFQNQFTDGGPGYGAGLQFELPLGRRAAKARLHRRELEAWKAALDVQSAIAMTRTSVETAVREVRTTWREMIGRAHSATAAESEVRYLEERWKHLPGDDRSAADLLEDLLDAQERAAAEDGRFTDARVGYVMALTRLRRATGTLLSPDGFADAPNTNPVTDPAHSWKRLPASPSPWRRLPASIPPPASESQPWGRLPASASPPAATQSTLAASPTPQTPPNIEAPMQLLTQPPPESIWNQPWQGHTPQPVPGNTHQQPELKQPTPTQPTTPQPQPPPAGPRFPEDLNPPGESRQPARLNTIQPASHAVGPSLPARRY